MKILMLVNWKILYTDTVPGDKQPPDYYIYDQDYWFYRYFDEKAEVDVLDISSFPWLEIFEKETIRFYIWQALKSIPKLRKYDVIVSHGMQSGIVVAMWRRFFKGKTKHIVFDIGSFASASESGIKLKLMQFASKSIDGIIYHTSSQIEYYKKYFPWIVEKSRFIRFGTDLAYFTDKNEDRISEQEITAVQPECTAKRVWFVDLAHSEVDEDTDYILSIGDERDWGTLIEAYSELKTSVKLLLVGHVEKKYKNIINVEQIPFVPISDLKKYIKHARFCVLPLQSYNYSYGQMTLMQQMAMGKCVVAARVPSLVDYGQDKRTVIFYEPGNVENLREIMRDLLIDTEKVAKIGSAARESLEYCNEMIMARNIEKFLNSVIQM